MAWGLFFFFSSRRRHTRCLSDWSSDVCSSDLSGAAKVDARWHTPVNAILSQGLCAMVMTVTPFPALVVYIGFSLTLFTVLSVASIFVYRRRRAGWQRLKALEFAWPLIPASYILVGTCMMVYGVIWQPRASLTALATVAAGALVYRYGVRVPRL